MRKKIKPKNRFRKTFCLILICVFSLLLHHQLSADDYNDPYGAEPGGELWNIEHADQIAKGEVDYIPPEFDYSDNYGDEPREEYGVLEYPEVLPEKLDTDLSEDRSFRQIGHFPKDESEIYLPGAVENGIPYSPVTGYEPGNNDYARAVIGLFGRDIKPDKLPFEYTQVDLPERQVQVFFAPEFLKGEKMDAFSHHEVKAVVLDPNKIRQRVFRDQMSIQALYPNLRDTLNTLNESKIFESQTKDVLFHELTHQNQGEILKEWQRSGFKPKGYEFNDYPQLHELGAYLGMLSVSQTPKTHLDNLNDLSVSKAPVESGPHEAAAYFVLGEIFKKVGFDDYVADKIIAEKKNAGIVLSETDIEKIKKENAWDARTGFSMTDFKNQEEFIKTLSDEKIREVAQKSYKSIFGKSLPSVEVIEVPERVVNWFKDNKDNQRLDENVLRLER